MDKHWINPPILPVIVNVHVIESVVTVFYVFIPFGGRVDGCTFFPPVIRGFVILAYSTFWVIIQAYPVTSQTCIYLCHIRDSFLPYLAVAAACKYIIDRNIWKIKKALWMNKRRR